MRQLFEDATQAERLCAGAALLGGFARASEAALLFGGLKRSDRTARLRLEHGDVVVWGGPARPRYHGVLPLEVASHPLTGAQRFNLTFRKAA
jgi:hypothetical protein